MTGLCLDPQLSVCVYLGDCGPIRGVGDLDYSFLGKIRPRLPAYCLHAIFH